MNEKGKHDASLFFLRSAPYPPPEKSHKSFAEQALLRILWIFLVVQNNYKKIHISC